MRLFNDRVYKQREGGEADLFLWGLWTHIHGSPILSFSFQQLKHMQALVSLFWSMVTSLDEIPHWLQLYILILVVGC